MGVTNSTYTLLKDVPDTTEPVSERFLTADKETNYNMIVKSIEMTANELVITTKAGSTVVVSLQHPDFEKCKYLKIGKLYEVNCTKIFNVYNLNYLN